MPALAPMLGALYRRPDPFEAAGAGAGAAPADPLVEVRHFVDGAPGDAFAIAPDGRVFLTEGGETTEVTRLDPEQLAALREAIAETGWPRLPDPLVGTAPDGADPSRAIR